MNKISTTLSVVALTALTAPAVTAATLIDDFTTFQRVRDTPTVDPTASNIVAPEAIGGWRSMNVSTSPQNAPTTDGATTLRAGPTTVRPDGILSFSNEDGHTGIGTIVYNANGAGLDDGVGLPGYDLTSGGIDDRFFFALNSFDISGAANFVMTVEDTGGGLGTFTELLDVTFDPFLRFSEVVGVVDFTKVSSLTFRIESTTDSFDGSISSISVVPLPASALLLLGGLGGFAGMSAAARRRRRKA
jgi:hypothetical protein